MTDGVRAPAARPLRAAWRLLRGVVHGVHGLLIAWACFGWYGAAQRHDATRWWSLKMLRLMGIALQVDGSAHSGGSLLVAVLFHAQVNGPAWPDAQPWDMYLFVVVAAVVVLVNRKAMLSRAAGATAILIDDDEPTPVRQPSQDRPGSDLTSDAQVERTA